MIARRSETNIKQDLLDHVPPLSNGDRLTADEFCRRWEATPGLKHAELIGGRVFMNPPISAGAHGIPQGKVLVWLGHYAIATDGVELISESSVHFGPQDLPQLDALLRIKEQFGGMSRLIQNELHGTPELVIEVAASSVSYDLFEKKQRYADNHVPEYLVWAVYEQKFFWFVLESNGYVQLQQARNGVLKSQVFPGLWLDTKGLLAGNWPKILSTLRNGMESPEYLEFAAKLRSQIRKKRKT